MYVAMQGQQDDSSLTGDKGPAATDRQFEVVSLYLKLANGATTGTTTVVAFNKGAHSEDLWRWATVSPGITSERSFDEGLRLSGCQVAVLCRRLWQCKAEREEQLACQVFKHLKDAFCFQSVMQIVTRNVWEMNRCSN